MHTQIRQGTGKSFSHAWSSSQKTHWWKENSISHGCGTRGPRERLNWWGGPKQWAQHSHRSRTMGWTYSLRSCTCKSGTTIIIKNIHWINEFHAVLSYLIFRKVGLQLLAYLIWLKHLLVVHIEVSVIMYLRHVFPLQSICEFNWNICCKVG